MNSDHDAFLYAARPAVRPEFAAQLFQHLSGLDQAPSPERVRRPLLRHAAWKYAAVSAFGLILVLTFSPAARAAAVLLFQQIGGFAFNVAPATPYAEFPTYNTLTVSLAQAQAELPFQFGLPTWVPEGFTLSDQVSVLLAEGDTDLALASNVYIRWSNDAGQQLILVPQPAALLDCADCAIPVGPDSLETVAVNGQPASLVRGGWSTGTVWDTSGGTLNLRWSAAETIYLLTGFEPSVTVDDLIRIAESVE